MGMDWDFMARVFPMYVHAGILTLRIAALGCALSLIVGMFCAAVKHLRIPVLRRIVAVYIEIARNTPLLVQLFFLYFGFPKLGIRLEAEQCAVIGLTFLGGAYMAETLRSGVEAMEKIQHESRLRKKSKSTLVISDKIWYNYVRKYCERGNDYVIHKRRKPKSINR